VVASSTDRGLKKKPAKLKNTVGSKKFKLTAVSVSKVQ